MDFYTTTQPDYTIAKAIIDHVTKRGSHTSEWYVGIATSPRDRLFIDHNVDEKNGVWIFKSASTESIARKTETYLLDKYNFKGGPGGGKSPRYVYAYKITATTTE